VVTISDAIPFHVLLSRDVEVSLMSLQVFLTLQIPILELVSALTVRGPHDDDMENHRSIVLLVALKADEDFQTFLVNFFLVDPMFPYEAIFTWGESQAAMVPVSLH
jgi:hypothetical protein